MKLIVSMLALTLGLSGCSSEADTASQVTTESEAVSSETTSEASSEVVSEADSNKEITTSGESTAATPYTSKVTITRVGSDITAADFEEFLEDGTSKNEASKAGTYTSPNYTLGEFYEQIDSLEQYVLDNDKFPPLTDGKDVDGVSGASVNLSGFEDAYNKALAKS